MKQLRKILLTLCLLAIGTSLLFCGCVDDPDGEKQTKGTDTATGEVSTSDFSGILPWDIFD